MSQNIKVNAQSRSELGKGASRRLRKTGWVPGVVYGSGADPRSISVQHNKLINALDDEVFYSSVLTLDIDGEAELVVLKDLQRHPAKPFIMHVDFQRVDMSIELKAVVPLHFLNEEAAPGIKLSGRISHIENDVLINCLPKDLPEFIEVDLGNMDIATSLHLSDIVMPEGVSSVQLALGEDHDLMVVSLNKC